MKSFHKCKVVLFLFFTCFIFNTTKGDLNNTEIIFSPSTPTASISADMLEICLDSQATITLEISDDNQNTGSPYTFIYSINGMNQDPVSSGENSNFYSFQTEITNQGSYIYRLVSVEDNTGTIYEVSDQEITITANDSPSVSFTHTNEGACSGEIIEFTSTITGEGPFTYNWSFGDGNTSTDENPSHLFNTIGNGTQNFSVTLSVNDSNGCSFSLTENILVQNKPDIEFIDVNGDFTNCSDGSSDYTLLLLNQSNSSSEISSYTIDWGDGSSPETYSILPTPTPHTYPIGIFSLVISATNENGCVNEVTYSVSNGSNPGGAFESPGSTNNLCYPTDDITFKITGLWGLNSENTLYKVDFGDGYEQNFTQQDLENSEFYNDTDPAASQGFEVYHSYTTGSCSQPNGEFVSTLTITNECGDTSFTIDSITVLEPSEAEFNVVGLEYLDENDFYVGCLDTPITFDNQTYIGDGINCAEIADFLWDFGDGTLPIFISGASTADDQTHTYTTPGNYTVTLTVIGPCGQDTYSKNICIEAAVETSYTVDSEEGCVPLEVIAENTTEQELLCSPPTYDWTVNYLDSNCGTFGDWEFTNGTNASFENPQFIFNSPGKYTITQHIVTDCGTLSLEKIIDVKKPPNVSIDPIESLCQPGIINPTAVIENCTDNLEGISYSWTFTGGTPSISTELNPENIVYDTPGIYTVTLEITNECGVSETASQEFEITDEPEITNSPSFQEICSGQATIPIPLTSSNSDTTYLWSSATVPTNPDISGYISSGSTSEIPSQTFVNHGNTPGNVIFTVTPVLNGCLGEPLEVLTVIVNPTPNIVTQPISSEVCLDGLATQLGVVTQNNVGTPTYQWYSNTTNNTTTGTLISGATSSTYDPPTATVGVFFYYVVISFDDACDDISSEIAIVTIAPEPSVEVNNPHQLICIEETPSDFEITLTGGVGGPTYQWFSNITDSNTGGTLISGATASTYNPGVLSSISNYYYYVEVIQSDDSCGFAISDVFTVEVVADPVIDSQAIAAQEVCQNSTLQDLIVGVSGGISSSNFNYQWYSNTINTTSGGTPISGATNNTITPDNTTVGTLYYYVVVTQPESGCEVISNTSEVIITPGPSITSQPISSEVCLDGLATQLAVVTQNGVGTPAYQWYSNTTNTYDLTNPIIGETTNTFNPPTSSLGEIFYFVTIAFEGGCDIIQSDIVSIHVNEIPVIDDAEITIYSEETFLFDPSSVTGNIVPSGTTYTWAAPTSGNPGAILGSSAESSPQTNISQTLENISSPPEPVTETYLITPAATSSCTGQPFALEVTVHPSLTSNALITNNSCFESNDGVIETTITGGVPFTSGPPYLISWTGPNSFTSSASTITNLTAGEYTLRIEDKSGIFIIESHMVTEPDILLITTDVEKNISCFDGNDGAIEVSISGGTAPYTYHWTGDGIIQGNQNQAGLKAGTYELEIIDDQQCVTNQTYILTEPEAIVISTVAKEDILCFGGSTGSIDISVSGGTPIEISQGVFDYHYNWSGPNGYSSTSQNITNLLAGTYTVEISDALGCSKHQNIIISEPTDLEITYVKTDISCYGENDGSISISVSGGEAPYQIEWNNFGSGFSQTNLSEGTYIATITDSNDCQKNISVTIEQPIFYIDPVVSPISCNDETDASIDLNISGGIAPITVTWNDDASAGIQRNNLGPGSYTVTIIDSDTNQCPIEETFSITNPPKLAVTSTLIDATDCLIANSGSIELDVSGGTPPYNFSWNTGQTSQDLLNIPAGDYSVEIEDFNGCMLTKEFTVFRQESLNISMTETILKDCNSNTIQVQNTPVITGGILPYTYDWSAGLTSGSSDEIMTTDQSGTYSLTVIDGEGCEETLSIQVDVPSEGNLDFSSDAFSMSQYGFFSVQDPIQFTNLSTGDFINVTWDFGDGSATMNSIDAVHTYSQVGIFTVTLTIEYDYGCVLKSTKTIIVTKGYSLILPNAFSPNEDGINDVIRPSFKGFTSIKMSIYDTWGVLLYSEEGTTLSGWNGFITKNPAENGNYVIYVSGITFFGQEIKKSTSITLLK